MTRSVLARLLPLAVLAASTSPAGSATLKGRVLLNQLGGAPVAGVGISARGANYTTSNRAGEFTLTWPSKEPGDAVQVTVEMQGYVVVNYMQLRVHLPRTADSEILTLLLSREEDYEEMARRFLGLKGGEAVEAAYQQKLKVLESRRGDIASEIARLVRERDQARAAAEETARELAKLKPGMISTEVAEAMSLFLDGRIDEALGVLNIERLRSEMESARRRKAEAENAMETAIRGYLLRGQLLVTMFLFDEAESTYQLALSEAPASFDANFAYAFFNQTLERPLRAREAYVTCVKLARRAGNEADVAMVLNNLGKLEADQYRVTEARSAYGEALKLYRGLATEEPESYLPDVAMTLNNVGNLEAEQNRMAEARMAYEEALKIRRELAERSPEAYSPNVAATLNNLGILHRDQNRIAESRSAHEEALKIYRDLAVKDPESYLPDLAIALNNVGNLEADQNRLAEARMAYEEALKIRRELAERSPEAYSPDVAATLNNLGILHRDQNRMAEARSAHEEALKIYRSLTVKNPESYRSKLALTLNNFGLLEAAQDRIGAARSAYEEALKIYRQQAKMNPEANLPDVAMTLNNLGSLELGQDRMDEARSAYEEALKIRRELAVSGPETYLPNVAKTLSNIGRLEATENRIDSARAAWSEALQIYESLSKNTADRFVRDVDYLRSALRDLEAWYLPSE